MIDANRAHDLQPRDRENARAAVSTWAKEAIALDHSTADWMRNNWEHFLGQTGGDFHITDPGAIVTHFKRGLVVAGAKALDVVEVENPIAAFAIELALHELSEFLVDKLLGSEEEPARERELAATEGLAKASIAKGTELTAPAEVADAVATFVPLHGLRSVYEASRPKLIHTLERDQAYHPGVRAERVDAMVADLTPKAFIRLLSMLAPDYRWNDGLPSPTPEESKEIAQHIVDALRWLDQLAAAHSNDMLACESSLKDAIAHGDLGAQILTRLDSSDLAIRRQLLQILVSTSRPGSRDRLRQIATHDLDPGVRSDAQEALDWLDRGGRSNQPLPGVERRQTAGDERDLSR